jgi:hypothetical protein
LTFKNGTVVSGLLEIERDIAECSAKRDSKL